MNAVQLSVLIRTLYCNSGTRVVGGFMEREQFEELVRELADLQYPAPGVHGTFICGCPIVPVDAKIGVVLIQRALLAPKWGWGCDQKT